MASQTGGADIQMAGDGGLRVTGDLIFATVAALLEQGEALIEGQRPLVIDLARVGNCDSAGLVLLLEWLERARAKGTEIRFRNVPDALQGIARLSNVDTLLPLVDG